MSAPAMRITGLRKATLTAMLLEIDPLSLSFLALRNQTGAGL